MDKMTHVKFNFNNFLMGCSDAFDKIFKENIHGVAFSSKRFSYIALRLSSYTNFTAEHFSDLLSYSLLYRLNLSSTHLEDIPFNEKTIYTDSEIESILQLSSFIENNIEIKYNMVVNQDYILSEISNSDSFSKSLKENFLDLSEDMTFWLNLSNDCQMPFYIYAFLQDFTLEIEYTRLIKLAEIINEIIYIHTNNKNGNTIGLKCKAMCEVYSLDEKDTARMIIASNLHCIGKLYIPNEIYFKSSTLTQKELDMIQAIPYFSYTILSSIFGFDDIAKLCSTYNEKLDGTGKPYELDGSNLSLKERLLAILVIYQALLEEKVYRKAFSHEDAIAILTQEATNNKLDLSIVKDLDKKFKK